MIIYHISNWQDTDTTRLLKNRQLAHAVNC